MGVPGASHAFDIAKSLGIEEGVLERARKHLSGESVEVEAVIRKLQDEVNLVENERERLEHERKKLESERRKYEEEYRKLRSKKIEEIDRQLKDLTGQVDDVMKKLESAIHALKKKKEEELKKAVKSLMKEKKRLKEFKIGDSQDGIKPGLYVRLKGGTSVGLVLKEKEDKVLVDFGTMKIEVPKSSLVIAKPPEGRSEEKRVEYKPTSLEKPEIDIRGMTVEEAEDVLPNFIDKLVLSEFNKGYIIHGKGTGRLAAGVWEILREDPRVKSYRFGTPGEGGTGVTVVEV